jgi:transposase
MKVRGLCRSRIRASTATAFMGVPTMAQVRSWAGLDVHASTVVAATVDRESGELGVRRLVGKTEEVVAFCAGLPGPTRVAYEAGPTGFALARALEAAGVGCVVAAPGKIERPAQDRVKTDRRDAERPAGSCGDEEQLIRSEHAGALGR